MSTPEYRRLVEKVDATAEDLGDRLRDSMHCGPGCASCCHVELTVVSVEADSIRAALRDLPTLIRASVRERARQADEAERRTVAKDARSEGAEGPRCVMLGPDNLCAIFHARPLVCRTQGLPLLYPEALIPVEAVLLRTSRGAITACPLNFHDKAPAAADALDAERLDTMLGLVDKLANGEGPKERTSLRALALGEE